MQSMYSICI